MPRVIPSTEMSLKRISDEKDIELATRETTFSTSKIADDKVIDYVLVYEETSKKNPKLEEYRKIFLDNLCSYGLKLKRVISDNSVFILIHAPFDILLQVAEKTNFKLPIEENNLETVSTARSFWNNLANTFTSDEAIQLNSIPRTHFTAPYSSSLYDLFAKHFDAENINNTLLEKDRSFLTHQILSRTSYSKITENPFNMFTQFKKGTEFGIDSLLNVKAIQNCFPLHQFLDRKNAVEQPEKADRQHLWEHWADPKKLLNFQPLHLIRNYFGEKLGFYFAYLGFYTSSLLLPSIVGLLVFVYGCIAVFYDIPTMEICDNSKDEIKMCPLCTDKTCQPWSLYESCLYAKLSFIIDNWATVFFSIFMSVWSVVLIDLWKRKQTKLQFEWNTSTEDKIFENIRPQFHNSKIKERPNIVTGEVELYQTLKRKILSYLASYSIVILMTALVFSFVFGTILYRTAVKIALINLDIPSFTSNAGLVTTFTSAIINLIIICLLGLFYSWIAAKLTDLENHRTDSEYESALTLKMYLFQFANFYASIFYIAFFKGRDFGKVGDLNLNEQCDQSGCLAELCIQLAIIMVGKQIFNNFQEVIIPFFMHLYKKRALKQQQRKDLRPWERDLGLMDWNNLTLFNEYLEMVIQFGFITMFVIAFPLGPLFAFLNNIFEIKIDSFKFLIQYKRPISTKANDIGIWLGILNFISKFGVITNGFLIAFTSDFIPRLVYLFGKGNSSLTGYVDFTLSVKNLTDFDFQTYDSNSTLCRFKDFKYSYDQSTKYEFTSDFWEVLAARLAFVVIFEHVVFGLVGLMHLLIPNTPTVIKNQMEREKIIIQRIEWEAQTLKNRNSENVSLLRTSVKSVFNLTRTGSTKILNDTESF